MPKRLVVCCDGTWNTPDQLSGGQPAPTNVVKLALAVAATDGAGLAQRTYYHSGVGTRQGQRLRGGAFGLGLAADVRDAYAFLVANYEPGDELFFLGFSRGAYTARSTAGFVRNAGILRPEHAAKLPDAYALYRNRTAHPRGIEAQLFRQSFSFETRIRFIGVWDTVGALGIPLNGLRFLNFVNRGTQFHDTDLSTTVDAAYQALAVDEHRKAFRPAVWNKQPSSTPQHVEQVWFTGVHCDVGGGYADHSLADVPLLWMVAKAVDNGLAIDHDVLAAGPFAGRPDGPDPGEPRPDPLGKRHESRTSFYKAVRSYSRPIERTDERCAAAAGSAVLRLEEDDDYTPANLAEYLAGAHRVVDVPGA